MISCAAKWILWTGILWVWLIGFRGLIGKNLNWYVQMWPLFGPHVSSCLFIKMITFLILNQRLYISLMLCDSTYARHSICQTLCHFAKCSLELLGELEDLVIFPAMDLWCLPYFWSESNVYYLIRGGTTIQLGSNFRVKPSVIWRQLLTSPSRARNIINLKSSNLWVSILAQIPDLFSSCPSMGVLNAAPKSLLNASSHKVLRPIL